MRRGGAADIISVMHWARILTAEALSGVRDQMERAGQKLVFTNGCFDLLHAGHVRYLQQARELGHALAVGLNSDRSVRELKCEGRPINAEDDRAEVVAALGCVDYVVIFDCKQATDLLRAVRPQVYAKGGDYTPESLDPDERAILAAADAEVQILPLLPGRSTTAVLERMCQP